MPRDSEIPRPKPAETGWQKCLMVLLGLILVSVLHFLTRTGDPALHAWHIFFRKLYFLPIVAGALWFGLRGALTTAVTAIGFYALHLLFDWPRFHLERMNQVGEMASFLVFAAVAGALVELERRTKARAEAIRRNAERKRIATAVASLSETLGARDPATRDHSRRVAELASGFVRSALSKRKDERHAVRRAERSIMTGACTCKVVEYSAVRQREFPIFL